MTIPACYYPEKAFIAPLMPKISIAPEVRLNAIENLARHALDALKELKHKNLSAFDPSVGDEACQIRALMVLKFASVTCTRGPKKALKALCSKITEVRNQINAVKNKYDSLKNERKKPQERLREEKKSIRIDSRKRMKEDPANKQRLLSEFQQKMETYTPEESKIQKELDELENTSHTEIQNIFAQASLDITLSNKLSTLILCYLVSKIKRCEVNRSKKVHILQDKTALRNLEIPNIPFNPYLTQIITANAKIILNERSIKFMQKEAKQLKGERARLIQDVMHRPLKSRKENLKEVSFYHATETVMERAKTMNIPIIIESRNPDDSLADNFDDDYYPTKQAYVVDPHTNDYISTDLDSNSVAMVISGMSENAHKEGLPFQIEKGGGLMEMVRLNAAHHPLCTSQQEPDPEILKNIVEDGEIERIKIEKNQAEIRGFSRPNFGRFQIEHVYANKVSNIFKKNAHKNN